MSSLVEDVSLGMAPLGGRSRSGATISLLPKDERVERLVADALQREDHSSLAEAITEFLQEAARTLVLHGNAPYEVVYYSENAHSRPRDFELARITPGSIRHTRKRVMQRIPVAVAEERGVGTVIEIPKENFILFRMPREYSRRRKRLLAKLSWLGTNLLPDFSLSHEGRERIAYDSTLLIRTSKTALAAVTKPLGWLAGGAWDGAACEFYTFHRFLTFEDFKLNVRKIIVSGLNSCLQRAGTRIGFTASIILVGFPTEETIRDARRKLLEGTGTAAEIIESFRF